MHCAATGISNIHGKPKIEEPLKTGLRQWACLGSSKEWLRGKLCLPTLSFPGLTGESKHNRPAMKCQLDD